MFFSLNYFIALILILTIHEAAHAWVALQLGDPTAHREGRVSLNPARHLSLMGTIMLFVANVGWGKPVPVNPLNFKNPRRDEALTALAGPMANLLLAILVAIPYVYLPASLSGWIQFCGAVMDLSLLLFLFNMLPIAPLDGATILRLFLPKKWHTGYEKWMQSSMPVFIALMVVDLYFLRGLWGFSVVWILISELLFYFKAAILLIV